MARIDITVAAEDQVDGDLVSSLISTTLAQNGFEDVTSLTNAHTYKTDEDVLEAMRNLSPSVFSSEITIGSAGYDSIASAGGESLEGDGVPSEEEFPDPDTND